MEAVGAIGAAEAETLARLVRQYERYMLVRAEAAAILRERGHDVTPLLGSTSLSLR